MVHVKGGGGSAPGCGWGALRGWGLGGRWYLQSLGTTGGLSATCSRQIDGESLERWERKWSRSIVFAQQRILMWFCPLNHFPWPWTSSAELLLYAEEPLKSSFLFQHQTETNYLIQPRERSVVSSQRQTDEYSILVDAIMKLVLHSVRFCLQSIQLFGVNAFAYAWLWRALQAARQGR